MKLRTRRIRTDWFLGKEEWEKNGRNNGRKNGRKKNNNTSRLNYLQAVTFALRRRRWHCVQVEQNVERDDHEHRASSLADYIASPQCDVCSAFSGSVPMLHDPGHNPGHDPGSKTTSATHHAVRFDVAKLINIFL